MSEHLTLCSKCEFGIVADDVYKTVDLSQSPQHVALLYVCPQCGHRSKMVAEQAEWAKLQRDSSEALAKRARTIRAAQIELDAVETAGDLVALWSSLRNPPILEDRMGACGCPLCRDRLYGQR